MATPIITHAKVSGKPLGPDPTRVYGADWDEDHVVTGLENVPNVDTTNASNLTSGTISTARLPSVVHMSVATIAALKAVAAPNVATTIYVTGYTAADDGGEGFFDYNVASTVADNGGTVIIPNSAPGTGRWIRARSGNVINVKWFGAVGDGVTSDTTAVSNALAVAIAIKGALYFPATSVSYLATIAIPDGTSGLTIFGDSRGGAVTTAAGGSFITNASATATLGMTATTGGNTNNIHVHDLKITNTGTGKAIDMVLTNWCTFERVTASSSGGIGLHIEGVGDSSFADMQVYGLANFALRIEDDGSTSAGPLTFKACQFSMLGGSSGATTGIISIQGSVLAVTFINCMHNAFGPNITGAIQIDGGGTSPHIGSIQFLGHHGESNYNTATVTACDFLIGSIAKAGSVTIDAGNTWGHGDGTHPLQDCVRIVAAQNVEVRNFTVSKLTAPTGYSRSFIRLESTFPAAGDTYLFAGNNVDNITGIRYSDANGKLTSATSDASTAVTIDSLALSNKLGAAYGGLGDAWSAYTPTVTAQSGTITTLGAVSGRFLQVGKTVFMQASVAITTSGTAAGGIVVTLPVAIKTGFNGGLSGATAAGVNLGALLNQSNFGNSAVILKYDGTTVFANGQSVGISGCYEAN